MTREDALARDVPGRGGYDTHHATGTDGERWFTTCWSPGSDDHWTKEILWNGRFFYWVEAETDPPGVDWAPGSHEPEPGTLPVTDPDTEFAKARGRGAPVRRLGPLQVPSVPSHAAPCECAACQRRKANVDAARLNARTLAERQG